MIYDNNIIGQLQQGVLPTDGIMKVAGGKEAYLRVGMKPNLIQIQNSVVFQREIVLITGITGNVISIDRAVEKCPLNDSATVFTQMALTFNSNDYFTLNITAEDINDIQADINTRALDSAVIHNTGNETGITGNKTFTGDITANKFIGDGSGITGITAEVNLTKSSVVSGEALTALDAVVYENGVGYKKSDASSTDLIDFKGFAISTVTSGNSVKLATGGVFGGFTGLTTGDYYLSDKVIEQLAFNFNSSVLVGEKNVSANIFAPRGLQLVDNGTTMYIGGSNGSFSVISKYTLSTPYSISTATYVSDSGNLGTSISGIKFNDDGTKLILVDEYSSLNYYTLSTGFDLSTISTIQDTLSLSGQGIGHAIGLDVSRDGTKVYVTDIAANKLFLYSMTTSWDFSTIVYTSQKASIPFQTAGIYVNNDGTKIFVGTNNASFVYEYTMSTPYDITTATQTDSQTIQTGISNADVFGVTFDELGENMYAVSTPSKNVVQLSTGTYLAPIEAGIISHTPGTNSVKVGEYFSDTELLILAGGEENNEINGEETTSATAGAITPPNIEGFITIKVNGTDKKIAYYGV